MTKDEFIKIIKDEYIEVDKICDLIVELEDIKLDIITHYFFENELAEHPESGWYCHICEHTYDEKYNFWNYEEGTKVFNHCSMRDAVISCICIFFNIE